jgi:hypothetical protein
MFAQRDEHMSYRQHRYPPCKERKDGAPTAVLLERKPKPMGGPPAHCDQLNDVSWL